MLNLDYEVLLNRLRIVCRVFHASARHGLQPARKLVASILDILISQRVAGWQRGIVARMPGGFWWRSFRARRRARCGFGLFAGSIQGSARFGVAIWRAGLCADHSQAGDRVSRMGQGGPCCLYDSRRACRQISLPRSRSISRPVHSRNCSAAWPRNMASPSTTTAPDDWAWLKNRVCRGL